MLQRFTRIAGLTGVLGFLAVPGAQASTHISVQIGAPAPYVAAVPVAPAPYAGYVWQPGYYTWTRFGYRWVPGTWVRPWYGHRGWDHERWEHERWEHRDWDRDHGHWDHDRGDWDRDRDRGRWRR